MKRLAISGALAVAVLIGVLLWQPWKAHTLTEKDTIVVGDFTNQTGEPVFDEALKPALLVQLEQSPFLNIFPDTRVRETLRFMGQQPDARLTPTVAREVCQREGLKAMLAGSISGVGGNYLIVLDAVNCATGDALAREQVEARGKERVLRAVAEAANNMRGRLGESLGSLQKYDAPVEQATTSSLDALMAFSTGMKLFNTGKMPEAIPHLQRAIDLDPNFAMAYARMGTIHATMGELERAVDYQIRAFYLRDRVSERERYYINGHYYGETAADLQKAMESYDAWRQAYPRDFIPYNNLAVLANQLGQPERGMEYSREAITVGPNRASGYTNLAANQLVVGDTAGVLQTLANMRSNVKHGQRSNLNLEALAAFLQRDRTRFEQVLGELEKVSPLERWRAIVIRLQVATYEGKFEEARKLEADARELATKENLPETAVAGRGALALAYGMAGDRERAMSYARQLLDPKPKRAAIPSIAITLALAGDARTSEKLINELGEAYPNDTLLHGVAIPLVLAVNESNRGDHQAALERVKGTEVYDFSGLYGHLTMFVRGLVQLRARQADEAIATFTKLIQHPGLDPYNLTYPLAHLEIARAYQLKGDKASAREMYRSFLEMWKFADAGLPVLQQAKTEAQRLG